jgi:hypothetical protein
MRNTALSLFAAFLMTLTFAVAPASADDAATGQRFSVSLQGLSDFAAPGDELEGQLSITIPAPQSGVRPKKQVFVTATVVTPFGEATIFNSSFRMTAGQTRTIPLSFPIEEDAAPGLYRIKIGVTIDGESLSVGHEVEVGGKR